MDGLNIDINDKVIIVILLMSGVILLFFPWLNITIPHINLNTSSISQNIKYMISLIGLIFFAISIVYIIKDLTSNKTNDKKQSYKSYDHLNCIDDNKRKNIIKEFKPDLYLPLESDFCDKATFPTCNTNVFPHIFIYGDTFNHKLFNKNGYKFDGKNLISVHLADNLPEKREARTFIFAFFPTYLPKDKPMFLFSYGQRISHKCQDGTNNHDKSFGAFWGEPDPKDEIPNEFKGLGLRIFFYCEHCKEDRITENCDTPVITNEIKLNTWYIIAITYDGDNLKFYKNGECIYEKKYELNTSKTPYINIGGFVHHNKKGALIAKDIDYTMHGYIREFMMIKNVALSKEQINNLTKKIQNLIQNNNTYNKSLDDE
jgi:hypothetical protein